MSRSIVFTIIAMPMFMMSLDSTIVATALSALQVDLDASINWTSWTITAYSFGFVLMLSMSGKLSMRYGKRFVFLGSVVVFTAASLCCGLASNIYMLIVLRALQAAGGAGFVPAATGIVVDTFGDVRDRAVSLFGSIFPIGAIVGPILGGVFVSYWSWRGVFFVNVPVGIIVIVLSWRYLPCDAPVIDRDRDRERLDGRGMAVLAVGLLSGMFAASYLGEVGARPWSPMFVVPLVVAATAVVGFFRHIEQSAQPLISPRFIRGQGFGCVNLVNAVYGGVTFGLVALVPLYAANRYGTGTLNSGSLLTAQGIAMIVFSIMGAFMMRRTGHRLPMYAGALAIMVGILCLAAPVPVGLPSYGWLAGSAFLIGVGSGAMNPPSRNAGLQLAPEHSSTLAALRTMCMSMGSIVTVSIATAVLASASDAGIAQAWVYVVAVLVMLATLPAIARVPEHRGSW